MSSACDRSTLTNWLTPRSPIVTPNSLSMRAMDNALWVITKIARVGATGHLVQQVTETRNIGIVQRRIHLVQHADRGGVWPRIPRKNQRQRGQRLLTARQ